MNYTKTTSRYQDDSEVIDIIESAKAEWLEAHPECELETDESTDEAINKQLGLPASGSVRGLALDLAACTPEQISGDVEDGLAEWFRNTANPEVVE